MLFTETEERYRLKSLSERQSEPTRIQLRFETTYPQILVKISTVQMKVLIEKQNFAEQFGTVAHQ